VVNQPANTPASPSASDTPSATADRHEFGPSLASRLAAETLGTFLLMVGGLSVALFGLPFNNGMTLLVGCLLYTSPSPRDS